MGQNVPTSVINKRVFESLVRGTPEDMAKTAQAASQMTRTQLREDSFAFKIMEPRQATDDMLVPGLVSDKLVIYEELEPDSPGAMWVPLQTVPDGNYIYGRRYPIPIARVLTPRNEKDLDELRVYRNDIRKIFTENEIKDALGEIDTKFIQLCNDVVSDNTTGAPGGIHNYTGKVQWMQFGAGLTPETLAEAKKMMLQGSTFAGMKNKFRLRNYVALMNDVTAQEFLKFKFNDIGDKIEEVVDNGVIFSKFFGLKFIFTIKGEQVPDGTVYFFPKEEFFGKCYYFTDWTMYMEKKAYMISSFAYWLGGMAIGNVAGVCRADFVI